MFNLGEYSMMKKSLVALAALAATGAFAQSSVTIYGVAEAGIDLGFKETTEKVTTTSVRNLVATPTVAAGAIFPNSTAVSRSGGTSKDAFRVQDGNANGVGTSRIGFRGTEDLGGGMKANFQIEMGLRLDDGSTGGGGAGGSGGSGGGELFGRNAWVGASGAFGEVRLGRQVTGSFGVHSSGLADGAAGGLYSAGGSAAGAFSTSATASAIDATALIGSARPGALMAGVRFNNAIKYISPNLGGFTGTLTIRAPEGNGDTTKVDTAAGLNPVVKSGTTTAKNKTGFDLAAEYANGPIYAGFGYFKVAGTKGDSNTTSTPFVGVKSDVSAADVTTKGFALSGSYDLGNVKPFLSYVNVKGTATGTSGVFPVSPGPATLTTGSFNSQQKVFTAGVRAPFGPVTIIGSISRNKLSESGEANQISGNPATFARLTESGSGKATAFNIGAQYALSKRTSLEANYGQVKATTSANTFDSGTGFVDSDLTNISTTKKTSAISVGVRHAF
jgi:predicted porin